MLKGYMARKRLGTPALEDAMCGLLATGQFIDPKPGLLLDFFRNDHPLS